MTVTFCYILRMTRLVPRDTLVCAAVTSYLSYKQAIVIQVQSIKGDVLSLFVSGFIVRKVELRNQKTIYTQYGVYKMP